MTVSTLRKEALLWNRESGSIDLTVALAAQSATA